MADQKERTFADGFIFKRKENAPEWLVGRLSVKVDEAVAFLKANAKNGWVNLDIKNGRSGNPYIELDTFEPKAKADAEPKAKAAAPPPAAEEEDQDLPF